METAAVAVDQDVARQHLREYREAKAPRTEQDKLIMRAYREIARGRKIIRARASIEQAGFDPDGLPKLALVTATAKRCRCNVSPYRVTFDDEANRWSRAKRFHVTTHDFHDASRGFHAGIAIVPSIPPIHRPKAGLHNYHILWEADWKRAPVDPMLLRHLQGDLWLVCAAWDLTDVERAALEQ